MPPTSASGISKTEVTSPIKESGMSLAHFKSKDNIDNGDNARNECTEKTKCNNNIEKTKDVKTSEFNNIMDGNRINTPINFKKESLDKSTPGFASSLLANSSHSSTNVSSQLHRNDENKSTEGQDFSSGNPHIQMNENKDSKYKYFQ